MYNRKDNFSRFDLETLFFAFYYQQGTHQQYMAAVELKKKNWKFNKKFVTWFKKDGPENGSLPASAFNINRQQSVSKTQIWISEKLIMSHQRDQNNFVFRLFQEMVRSPQAQKQYHKKT